MKSAKMTQPKSSDKNTQLDVCIHLDICHYGLLAFCLGASLSNKERTRFHSDECAQQTVSGKTKLQLCERRKRQETMKTDDRGQQKTQP